MKKLQWVILLAIAAFVALGYMAVSRGIKGVARSFGGGITVTGAPQTQTRSVNGFERVVAGSVYDVDISFGSTPSVKLDAPSDLLPHLTSTVHDGTLELGSDIDFDLSGNQQVKAHVVVTKLTGVEISGAGHMVVNGDVTGAQFEATASGASSLEFSCKTDSVKIETSGSAQANVTSLTGRTLDLDASGASGCTVDGTADKSSIELSGSSQFRGRFTSNQADVHASGASSAELNVKDSITGEASGASSIHYGGSPRTVNVQTSGVSSADPR